jgi:hypothetical protein
MSDDFKSCKAKDDSEYDYFSCQFFESLTKYQPGGDNGYWFGRMLAYGYTVQDFLTAGDNYVESGFRSEFENQNIILVNYNLLNVSYLPDPDDPNNPDKAIATGIVELEIYRNGQKQIIQRNFTHKLKRTWHATQTVFS